MVGTFRDGHPRLEMVLHSERGVLQTEFIVDTGFEGDLSLPSSQAVRLSGQPNGARRRILANGTFITCPFYEVLVDWEDGRRLTEVLVLDGHPLLGTTFLQDYLLQVEVVEGGGVAVERL